MHLCNYEIICPYTVLKSIQGSMQNCLLNEKSRGDKNVVTTIKTEARREVSKTKVSCKVLTFARGEP